MLREPGSVQCYGPCIGYLVVESQIPLARIRGRKDEQGSFFPSNGPIAAVFDLGRLTRVQTNDMR